MIEIILSFTLESSTCQVLLEQTLASKVEVDALHLLSCELRDHVNKAPIRVEKEDLGDKELRPKLYRL